MEGRQSTIHKAFSQKKLRSCLMCCKVFNSKGIGNRRCTRCTRLVGTKNNGDTAPFVYKVGSETPIGFRESYYYEE